jgi:hypothetical protein
MQAMHISGVGILALDLLMSMWSNSLLGGN